MLVRFPLMQIDWAIAATFTAPIITLFIGAALNRMLERRPQVIAYFTHASSFRIAGPNPAVMVNTHGIVIKNAGHVAVTDVRVRHHLLPENFNVFPDIQREILQLPGGGREIVFPRLVPGEQVSISYLYLPPILYNQIHAGIRHSQGFAKEVTILPSSPCPSWLTGVLWIFVVVGAGTSLCLMFCLCQKIWMICSVLLGQA